MIKPDVFSVQNGKTLADNISPEKNVVGIRFTPSEDGCNPASFSRNFCKETLYVPFQENIQGPLSRPFMGIGFHSDSPPSFIPNPSINVPNLDFSMFAQIEPFSDNPFLTVELKGTE